MRRPFEKTLAKALGLNFPDNDPVWCDAREVLITGGYRSGKSTRGAFKALCKLLNPATRLMWFIGPEYFQAQEEFRYVLEWCLQLGLVKPGNYATPADGIRWLKTVTGCTLQTRSAAHAERLASVAPNFILLCEPGQMSSEVYETALARLAEKRGDLWMVGTLEDSTTKTRWQWYEDLAVEWANNTDKDSERSFTLPTWSNTTLYPDGPNDPEMMRLKAKLPEYTWNRRYMGIPMGVNNPAFPSLWEPGAANMLLTSPAPDLYWVDGAIGVDYGKTVEHPSTVVVILQASDGTYWVREGWRGYRVRYTEIQSIVESFKERYDVFRGCCDPNQTVLADMLNFSLASGGRAGGGQPTLNRFNMVNTLLWDQRLFFDINGIQVREIWASMKSMGMLSDGRGKVKYERPLDDDLGQAVCYAVEVLQADPGPPVPIDVGAVRLDNGITYIPPTRNGGFRA